MQISCQQSRYCAVGRPLIEALVALKCHIKATVWSFIAGFYSNKWLNVVVTCVVEQFP